MKRNVARVAKGPSSPDQLSGLNRSLKLKKAANNNIANKEVADYLRRQVEGMDAARPGRQDQRLWETLTDNHFKSAQKIYYGFQGLVSGGYRTQVFSGLPGGRQSWKVKDVSELAEIFSQWANKASQEKILINAVLDILIFGLSCREVDRRQKKRKGFAKKNLLAALDIYILVSKENPYQENCVDNAGSIV